jgi:hypothetical protein
MKQQAGESCLDTHASHACLMSTMGLEAERVCGSGRSIPDVSAENPFDETIERRSDEQGECPTDSN